MKVQVKIQGLEGVTKAVVKAVETLEQTTKRFHEAVSQIKVETFPDETEGEPEISREASDDRNS